MPPKKKETSSEEVKITTAKNQLSSFLQEKKEDHYQFEDPVDVLVSSGSLIFDAVLGGGIGPGLHRFCGINEGGKLAPLSEPVLTPNGWTEIGKLKIGDKIINSDGGEQEVLGIYPQGIKEIFEVVFDDGSKTNCGLEHLWETSNFQERHKHKTVSVKTLAHIKETLKYGSSLNHAVRIIKPVIFEEKNLLINPYLLGVIIGDGGITKNVNITNIDQEIWTRVEEIVSKDYSGLKIVDKGDGKTKNLSKLIGEKSNKLIHDLRQYGLYGLKSESKFIPEAYKFSSISQRLDLLHGLIDTDGYVQKKKSEIIYYTVSERLSNDVIDLVRSLGGIARKRKKPSSYIDEDGQRVICKDCYCVSFHLPKGMNPCFLSRKLKRVKPRIENFLHFIKEVRSVGFEESVCIKVSALDSLYVTRDYILTHNTSCALSFLKSFLNNSSKRRGVLVKAEGRLSKEMQQRSGVKFVFKAEEWEDGTCFVFESNVYETVIDLFRDLVKNNDEGIQYFFILDSVDGLILRNDLVKETEESNKVAGGAVLASTLMKKMAIALQKRGHIAIFISQVRADVQLDPYSKEPVRQTTATGGNALLHFANFIFEFQPRFGGDVILQNPDEKQDTKKNPPIGHLCTVAIKKSPNEKTGLKIKYPIKYGRKNGTSNWIEREIFDLLSSSGCLMKKGAWLSWEEDFFNDSKLSGVELPEKVHGVDKFNTLVETNESVRNYLISYCKASISKDIEQNAILDA